MKSGSLVNAGISLFTVAKQAIWYDLRVTSCTSKIVVTSVMFALEAEYVSGGHRDLCSRVQ